MNLIKKLTATLLITSTLALSSCGETEDISSLTANLSADASTGLTNVIFIMPETTKENNYVSIIAHFDMGSNYSNGRISVWQSYKNHKDYRITYKVSKEDYADVVKIYSKDKHIDANSKKEDLEKIQNIIDTYDPIEVADLGVDDKYKHDSYQEEFYFDEEKYLNEIN